jgi:hypothetical protein
VSFFVSLYLLSSPVLPFVHIVRALGNCIPVVSLFRDPQAGERPGTPISPPEGMSEPVTPPNQPQPSPTPPPSEPGPESRQDLLSKAQAFLTSPQIRDQDDAAKRKFLTEKGLTPAEVDYLLQGIVSVST